MKTVEVEAVKSDPFSTWRKRVVVCPSFPIILDADGTTLIDGRNRLRACEMAGVELSLRAWPSRWMCYK